MKNLFRRKSVHTSHVTLGKTYKDTLTGVEAYATTISFFRFGCTRVGIEWLKDGTMQTFVVDDARLADTGVKDADYKTEIVLGEKYKDEQSGIEGLAEIVTFGLHGCERVTIEYKKDGDPHEATFDAPRLTKVGEEKPVKSERTGGPARSNSHVRTGPVR